MDYTAEDEVIIKEKWDDLLLSCTKICKNDEDWNFIKRAFFLAKEAHQATNGAIITGPRFGQTETGILRNFIFPVN